MKVEANYIQRFDAEKGLMLYVPILESEGETTSISGIEFGVETVAQALAISELAKAALLAERRIAEHNDSCIKSCGATHERCGHDAQRGIDCSWCPKDWIIEL